jgi:serine/threonine protein kinase
MLGAYGETLLVDWGLAKVDTQAEGSSGPAPTVAASFAPSATQPGDSIGTLAFAGPEQLKGHVDRISARSDVYSLGATLYCLLTGKHPLTDSDLPMHLDRIARNRLPVPREVRADVPAPLDASCRKAMAVEPSNRYSTPQELARDLELYMSDEPISLPCEGWRPRIGRWLRKHPVGVAATLITVCFGLFAGCSKMANRESSVWSFFHHSTVMSPAPAMVSRVEPWPAGRVRSG